jgi:hypothetical protein
MDMIFATKCRKNTERRIAQLRSCSRTVVADNAIARTNSGIAELPTNPRGVRWATEHCDPERPLSGELSAGDQSELSGELNKEVGGNRTLVFIAELSARYLIPNP